MIEVKDDYTLGVAAGLIANTVRTIFALITCGLGYRNYFGWNLASSAVLPKEKTSEISALFIGGFTDYAIAGVLGVVTIYLLSYTGFRYYILKGFSVGTIAWLLIYIPITQSEISKITPSAISANISFLIGHLLLGVVTAVVIVKYKAYFKN